MNLNDFDAALETLDTAQGSFTSKVTNPHEAVLYDLDALISEADNQVTKDTLNRIAAYVKAMQNETGNQP